MKKLFLAVCMLVPLLSAAMDCSKARTPTEKTMCSDPSLRAQNDYLEVLYSQIHNSLLAVAPETARQVTESERYWIRSRDQICGAKVECISSQLYSRANELYDWGMKANLVGQKPKLSGPELYRFAMQYVAKVETTTANNTGALGSAIKLWPDYFITNHHVVEGAKDVYVEYEGKRFKATVTKAKEQYDLAVLYVPGVSRAYLPAAPLYSLTPGQTVYALGNPRGLVQTISNGIVSAIRADVAKRGFMVIQNTAPISPGSSGGALLNEHGEVVGVTTYSLGKSQQGEPQLINFAIPMEQIAALLLN